jgi:hypothetical protein
MPVKHEKDTDPQVLEEVGQKFRSLEPEPGETFHDNGLRFPLEWLRELGLSLVLLPLEWQARYVDEVTYFATSSVQPERGLLMADQAAEFCQSQLQDADTAAVDQMNATSIGNLAFMALYAGNAEHRVKALAILNRIEAVVVEQARKTFGN